MLIAVALGRGDGILNRGVRRWLFISRSASRSAASSPAPCRCCFSEKAPPAARAPTNHVSTRARPGLTLLAAITTAGIAHERFHRPFGGREDLPRRGGRVPASRRGDGRAGGQGLLSLARPVLHPHRRGHGGGSPE